MHPAPAQAAKRIRESRVIAALKSGDWVSPARIRRVSWLMVVFAGAALFLLLISSNGMQDFAGRPLGTDFSDVWSAGKLAREGAPEAAYDPALHYAAQQQAFADPDVPLYGWHYPPFFLLVAAALSLLPYTLAWGAWMAATLPVYMVVVRRIAPVALAPLAALAFPAVFVNLTHGQNGFLTAALIGGAMHVLDRRPLLAGLLIGLLAYKPQFGVLIPLILIATGRWKTFAAASATVLVLISVTYAAFGRDIWLAFFDSAWFTRAVVLEAGDTGFEKMQSIFAAARLMGGPVSLAYALQGVLALGLAVTCVWIWRSRAGLSVKAAALITASLLATPYAMDYDMTALAPAIAFLAARGLEAGFRPWEKTALAAAWTAPLFARSLAGLIGLPLGLIAMLGLYAVIFARARTEHGVELRSA